MPKKKKKSVEKKVPVGDVYEFVAKINDPDFHKRPCAKFNHETILRSYNEFVQRFGLETF